MERAKRLRTWFLQYAWEQSGPNFRQRPSPGLWHRWQMSFFSKVREDFLVTEAKKAWTSPMLSVRSVTTGSILNSGLGLEGESAPTALGVSAWETCPAPYLLLNLMVFLMVLLSSLKVLK